MADVRDAWMAFLDPNLVRTKLVSAGLYLVAHEMLLDSIKRHPLSFFADRWTQDGPEASEEYEAKILALDPKGKRDALRGSIAWLRSMDAISEDDESNIRVVTDARNQVAHEMSALVAGLKDSNFFDHFETLIALTAKIERWWIVNVEIEVNPDLGSEQVDEEAIIPGPTWAMRFSHG